MEVHHHAHTNRKKWTHYFWEFLMLFLAVFCGFLAENQREHYIEHQRAKELAKSLREDLKIDTATFHQIRKIRSEKINNIDSLLSELKNYPASANISKIYHHVYKIIFKIHFKRAEGTVDQLKNSGYLRYFSKTSIPNKLMEYDRIVGILVEFENTYDRNLDQFVYLVFQHLDADIANNSWANPRTATPVHANAPLYNMDKMKLNYFKYNAVSLKHLNLVSVNVYIDPAEQKAKELMDIIQKEIHLK